MPAALAQAGFPTKPITIIVPYTAGGASDVSARLLQNELSKAMGQPVVLDNVAGAGGALGVQKLLRSPSDGHTLLTRCCKSSTQRSTAS
jgi:tripartite-type tricarboxylate transporter receptor subunit TctC